MSTSHNAFLPPDLRELIDADRHAPDPSEAVRQDVARRVDRALGLGGAMLIPSPGIVGKWSAPAGPAAAPAVVGIAAWKIAVGVAVVALAGGGGFTLAARQANTAAIRDQAKTAVGSLEAARVAPASNAAPQAVIAQSAPPSVSLDLDAPFEGHASSKSELQAQSTERARPARAPDRLADERKVLDRARSALVRHDAADALSAIRSHERSFGRGQLVEERESMRVLALVLAHDFGSARAAGERFHKLYSRSMFLPVVDRALESAR